MRYAGLMNMGAYTRIKLLGYVDLPITTPNTVSVMTNGAVNGSYWGERWATADNPFPLDPLDTQAARDFWANEAPQPKGYRATGGYVLVGSRAENKVAVVDLAPLIQWFRSMYFTTQDKFDQTKNEGDLPDQWPFTFDIAPQARPVVSTTIALPMPTSVWAGWPQAASLDSSSNKFERAFVGTLDGQVHILNIGGWTTASSIEVKELKSIPVGRNPTGITVGSDRNSDDSHNQLIVVSRGDRQVSILTPDGVVLKTLRDDRMVDPVQAQTTENSDLRITDFHGKQVLSYLYHNLYIWKMGEDGKAQWEFSQTFPRPGAVVTTSSVLFY
jgi:hypothetical protein